MNVQSTWNITDRHNFAATLKNSLLFNAAFSMALALGLYKQQFHSQEIWGAIWGATFENVKRKEPCIIAS